MDKSMQFYDDIQRPFNDCIGSFDVFRDKYVQRAEELRKAYSSYLKHISPIIKENIDLHFRATVYTFIDLLLAKDEMFKEDFEAIDTVIVHKRKYGNLIGLPEDFAEQVFDGLFEFSDDRFGFRNEWNTYWKERIASEKIEYKHESAASAERAEDAIERIFKKS